MSVRDKMDHPIPFGFFVTLTVIGMLSLITWGAKKANIPGLAALAQHP